MHCILPIDRSSYPIINLLLERKTLTIRPSQDLGSKRAPGTLYYMPSVQLMALNDTHLKLDDQQLIVPLYRLPTAEQHAIIVSSPTYSQYVGLNELSLLLRSPSTDRSVAIKAIQEVLQSGRQPTRKAALTLSDPLFHAHWHSDQLIVQKNGDHWFAVLAFDLTCTGPDLITRTAEVALDLGANPLIHACTANDVQFTADSPPSLRDLYQGLSSDERAILDRVTIGWHRLALQRFLNRLSREAAIVYAEDLTYKDMFGDFVQNARRNGVIDFHESWLHHRLQTISIPFEKVDPTGTSQRCSFCPNHPRGNRKRDHFACPSCGRAMNAHWNAARNILRLGRAKAKERGTAVGTLQPSPSLKEKSRQDSKDYCPVDHLPKISPDGVDPLLRT